MSDDPTHATHRVITRLVRDEHRALVGWLVARLGGHQLDLAEDVAQDALLAALSNWPYKGMPDNPGAWLRTVARNRAIDRLRKEGREIDLPAEEALPPADGHEAATDDVFATRVPDPDLRLVLLCCHPELGEEDRLALTLKVVGGFTAREIAAVLLKPETAVAQRLARAKRRLRETPDRLANEPDAAAILERSMTALKVTYLIFSAGYAPRSGDQLVRHDVCAAALRLARTLADTAGTSSEEAQALAGLLCLQSSRLDAREDERGMPVLMRDQDRSAWDQALITEGFRRLGRARGDAVSRYHLEAAIASLHSSAARWEDTDWQTMARLYDTLGTLTKSPVVALNGAVARAMAGEPERAMRELDALATEPRLLRYAPLHVARAEVLRRLGRNEESETARQQAMESGTSAPVLAFLQDQEEA